jgi:phosphoserine phosphatase
MSAILCVVLDPTKTALERPVLAELQAIARAAPDWLEAGRAVEFAAPGLDPEGLRAAVRPLLTALPVDWAVLPAAGRRKRLLIADMDSTMIGVECIDELADLLGIKEPIAAVTRRAMNGELDFKEALRARVALLAGLPTAAITEICETRVRANPGAATLVATMRAHGARAVLVSGGFTGFTCFVKARLGFDVEEANDLEIRDGRLTGALLEPLRDASSKLGALHRHCAELGIAPAAALALGDGANDLPMLGAAGLGIAYRAHPRVKAAIATHIEHTDLRAALFFQGYRPDELITG